MKTKIIFMMLVATLLVPTTAFADTNVAYSNENSQTSEQFITANDINYTIIEIESSEQC